MKRINNKFIFFIGIIIIILIIVFSISHTLTQKSIGHKSIQKSIGHKSIQKSIGHKSIQKSIGQKSIGHKMVNCPGGTIENIQNLPNMESFKKTVNLRRKYCSNNNCKGCLLPSGKCEDTQKDYSVCEGLGGCFCGLP